MKRNSQLWISLVALGLFATLTVVAQPGPATNRLTFSARFGLNISAKFSGSTALAVPPSTRTTPDGDTYNYDNGYVLPDVSGSGDGQTWYWGYDDSSSQVDSTANTILLSRSMGTATLSSPEMDDPSIGMELTYTHELGFTDNFRFGFEGALNFMNIDLGGSGSYNIRGTRTTDAYAFTPGTTPPSGSYEGTFNGPGFVISSTPSSSTTTMAGSIGTASGSRDFEGNLWGARLGPYAEFYLNDDVSVSLSGGLAVGWLNSSVSWNESLVFNNGSSVVDTGSGDDNALLVGGYLAANLYWRISEHWSAAGSLQFQSLGNYDESFGTRRVELDLSQSFLFSLGASYDF